MAAVNIPLKKVPSQKVVVVLDNQRCVIILRQMGGRQYFSLSSDGVVICSSVLIQDNSRLSRVSYKGFSGEFKCIDTRGSAPPEYTGWGDRWLLLFNPGV